MIRMILAASLAIAGPAIATAQAAKPTAPEGYAEAWARLAQEGYRNIVMADATAGRVRATDAQGSEVLVQIDADGGTILSRAYVHPGDK